MTFHTYIFDSQRMNRGDFGDALTFPVAPQAGQSFHLSCETSRQRILTTSDRAFSCFY